MKEANTVSDQGLLNELNGSQAVAESFREELMMAGRVQRDFLPRQLPDFGPLHWSTVFLPTACVSGDIYDVARLDEEHVGFYVADVVGHGIPAALLTIFLKQTMIMRETAGDSYKIYSPSEVITNLNGRMTGQKLSDYQFATCCYCVINTSTLELTYARAGHPYPILIRPGEPPRQLEIQGALLGIFEHAMYEQQTIQLRKGDRLILYSDGVEPFIGAFKEQSEFQFHDEFCKATELPISEMMDKLTMVIQNRKPNESELDDITLVGLEIV